MAFTTGAVDKRSEGCDFEKDAIGEGGLGKSRLNQETGGDLSSNGDKRRGEVCSTSTSARALFLAESTNGFQIRSKDETGYQNDSFFTMVPETTEPLVEPQTEPPTHADDCTPSCGPNYLIEVQNPTWEVSLYVSFVSAMEALASENSEDTCILEDLSCSFTETISSGQSDYESTLSESRQSKADPFMAASELMNSGKIVEAIPLLENSIRFRPKNCEVWVLLALANYLSQNDLKAMFSCKECLRGDVEKDESSQNLALLLLATCLLNEGDLAAAQAVVFEWMIRYLGLTDAVVRNILKSVPLTGHEMDGKTFVPVLLVICNLYALRMVSDGTLQWAMAILYFGTGNYAIAIKHFEQVLVKNPKSPSVMNQVGACLHNLHMHDKALALQHQALQICHGFPRAVYNKALTLCAMNNINDALVQIQQTMEHHMQYGVEISDQFWYLAAKISSRLNCNDPLQRQRRARILSAILSRDVAAYKVALHMDPSS